MVYSEAGGVTKTTTAVSVAMIAAQHGHAAVLIDLDPRAAATRWLNVEPAGPGLHVGAIMADPAPHGWVDQIAVPSPWHPGLRVVPSARSLSNRETERADHAELRLTMALRSSTADVVVLDCPNRQGGLLTQSALTAADAVLYAATATQDGVDGYTGARTAVEAWRRSRDLIGAPASLREAGIAVGAVEPTILSRPTLASLDTLRDSGLLLTPLIPRRAIVGECRIAGLWYGDYTKGAPVLDAYQQIYAQLGDIHG